MSGWLAISHGLFQSFNKLGEPLSFEGSGADFFLVSEVKVLSGTRKGG